MSRVWHSIKLTPKAEAELLPHTRDIAQLDDHGDRVVAILVNALGLSIDGQDVRDFTPGFRLAFVRAKTLNTEMWVKVGSAGCIALRPDEFMSETLGYTLDYQDGLFVLSERR